MNSWLNTVLIVALMLGAGAGLFGVRHAAAQGFDWIQLFGTSFADEANGVAIDADGNFYLAGTTGGRFDGQTRFGGLRDAYLRKLDADGKEIWVRQFGTIGDDEALSVAIDHAGGILVAGVAAEDIPGRMRVSGFGGAYVRKFDPDGNEQWMRHFGISQFSQANGVAVDQDDNVFITGQISGALPGQTAFGSNDGFLRAYDTNGEELWTRQFGTGGGDSVSGIAVDGDGAVYVVGSTEGGGDIQGTSSGTAIQPFVRKFDRAGSEVWSLRIPADGFAKAMGVAVDDGGRLYVAGWVSGSIDGQRQIGRTDAFLIYYDRDGIKLWSRQFGTPNEDRALGVGVDTNGNAYAVGWTRGVFLGQTGLGPRTVLERQDAFISGYDRLGNELWTRQIGTKLLQRATGVTAAHGGVYVVGNTTGTLLGQINAGVTDGFLLKLAGEPPRDPAIVDSPELKTIPALAVRTLEPENVQTPLPVTAAKPSAPEPRTPAAESPAGGSCGLSGGSKADSGWLLTVLIAPGLLWVRRKVSDP